MKTRLVIMIIGLAFFTGPVLAEQPLADRLPAGAVAYIGWAGKSLTFDGSMFGQLIADRSISGLVGAIKDAALPELSPEGGEMFACGWEIASLAWRHPIAAALTELEPREGKEPLAQAVMLIDLGEDRVKFDEQVAKITAKLQEDHEITDKTVGDITFKTAKVGEENAISFGYIGNLFFFMIGPKGPEIITGLMPDKTLAADRKFIDAFRETGGENEQISLYVDFAAVRDSIEKHLDRAPAPAVPPPATTSAPEGEEVESGLNIKKLAASLGMDKATALVGSVRIVDRHLCTKFKLFSPAPHRGVLMPFAGAALTDADLSGLPADADLAAAVKVSPSELYREFRRIVREIDTGADEELAEAIADFENNVQISLEKDLLAALGDTWVISSAPSQGGFITGTVLSATIKDKDKLNAAIAKIETYAKEQMPQNRRMQLSIETIKADCIEIHYLSIASQRMPIPLSPAWAINGDKFYFALWPQVLETTFARESASPLTATETFTSLRKRVSPNASYLVYMNTPSLIKQLYPLGLLGGSAGMAALKGMVGDPSLPNFPPPLHTLEKYFSPEIYAVSSDKTGIIFEGYSAQPSIMGVGSPVGISMLLPALCKARQSANKARSMANLRGIGKAFALYQGEHEVMPEHLGLLVDENLIGAEMFVSPLSGRKPPKFNKETKQLEGELDYIYLDFTKVADFNSLDGDLIMVYERPENYGNRGTLVCHTCGSVTWMDMEEFEAALERTKKAIKAAEESAEDF